jgi:hypothetical protein
VRSLLGSLGGNLGREITYLGAAGVDTPIWDVLAPWGKREGAGERLRTGSRSPGYPIRQVVPIGLGYSFWAHLWGVLVRRKMYLRLIRLIKTYSTFYMAIGGRDGVDGGGWVWMTCSINRTPHQLGAWGFGFAAGLTALSSLYLKSDISVLLIYLNIIQAFPCLWGSRNGWMGHGW